MTPMRQTLRHSTAAAHARLDRAFGALDLCSRAGLGRFLAAHEFAFAQLSGIADLQSGLLQRRAAIAADLKVLGWPETPAQTPISMPSNCDALGADYVLAGSHLGQKILRRDWSNTPEPIVRSASNFMMWDGGPEEWANVQTRLAAHASKGEKADAIIAGANWTFERFSEGFNAVRATPDAPKDLEAALG